MATFVRPPAHGFVIPQFRNGKIVMRGSNTRNRYDRRDSVDSSGRGIIGWEWNNETQKADIPVRE